MNPAVTYAAFEHILNHLQEAKTTEKSWSLTINSKFNAICCFNVAVLHPNTILNFCNEFLLTYSHLLNKQACLLDIFEFSLNPAHTFLGLLT